MGRVEGRVAMGGGALRTSDFKCTVFDALDMLMKNVSTRRLSQRLHWRREQQVVLGKPDRAPLPPQKKGIFRARDVSSLNKRAALRISALQKHPALLSPPQTLLRGKRKNKQLSCVHARPWLSKSCWNPSYLEDFDYSWNFFGRGGIFACFQFRH